MTAAKISMTRTKVSFRGATAYLDDDGEDRVDIGIIGSISLRGLFVENSASARAHTATYLSEVPPGPVILVPPHRDEI